MYLPPLDALLQDLGWLEGFVVFSLAELIAAVGGHHSGDVLGVEGGVL